MQSETVEFPTIGEIQGDISADGQRILLQFSAARGGAVQFGLRMADLESFVTLLLRMAACGRADGPAEDRLQYQPIPASGVSAGELADGMGCLGVTVGGTELMFEIPVTAISGIAHTLLTVGAQEPPRRLS